MSVRKRTIYEQTIFVFSLLVPSFFGLLMRIKFIEDISIFGLTEQANADFHVLSLVDEKAESSSIHRVHSCSCLTSDLCCISAVDCAKNQRVD